MAVCDYVAGEMMRAIGVRASSFYAVWLPRYFREIGFQKVRAAPWITRSSSAQLPTSGGVRGRLL